MVFRSLTVAARFPTRQRNAPDDSWTKAGPNERENRSTIPALHGVYLDRTAGGDSDYRRHRRDLVPGLRAGSGSGAEGDMPEQPQADRQRNADVCPGL